VNSPANAFGPIKWIDVRQPYIPHVSAASSLPKGLARAIARIECAVGRRDESDKRAVPSAGACYPYEILISPLGGSAVGLVDLHRRKVVVRCEDRDCWEGDAFAYFLVGRPWLSMRKYGRRGFLYHLLDIGHAILNLTLVASDAGGELSAIDSGLVRSIVQQSAIRGESVLGIGLLDHSYEEFPRNNWLLQQTVDPVQAPPSDIERMVDPILPPPPQPVKLQLKLDGEVAGLAKAISKRRSAARLRDSLPAEQAKRLAEDCVDLCQRVIPALGLPGPGLRSVSRNQLSGITLSNSDWMDRALIGQTDLASASAFIVVHTKIGDDTADILTPSAQQLIISCGIAGELAYLSATDAGFGVTGIGGINPRLWADACQIGEDVLYLVAIGDAIAGEKFDVTNASGHHG
jgi:hypothetical protein